MVIEVQNPPCPKCKGASNKLKFDGFAQIYECTAFKCLEQFRVQIKIPPHPGYPPPAVNSRATSSPSGEPPSIHSRRTSDVEAGSPETNETKEKPMAVNEAPLVCRKYCAKEFRFEAWREKHESKCGAKPKTPEPRAAVEVKAPKEKKPAAPRRARFADAIQELRVSRIEKEQEIAAIDTAIEALEKLG